MPQKINELSTALEVSLNSEKKRHAAARRAKRYRLQKQLAARPFATVHSSCRECSRPITPSICRAFCAGGECQQRFFGRVQVTRVEPNMEVLHGC